MLQNRRLAVQGHNTRVDLAKATMRAESSDLVARKAQQEVLAEQGRREQTEAQLVAMDAALRNTRTESAIVEQSLRHEIQQKDQEIHQKGQELEIGKAASERQNLRQNARIMEETALNVALKARDACKVSLKNDRVPE